MITLVSLFSEEEILIFIRDFGASVSLEEKGCTQIIIVILVVELHLNHHRQDTLHGVNHDN
jgi:hypothetical protein